MRTAALALLAILTALRLWLAAVLPVTPLEAFHWLCAHRLDWAFFDSPPGAACLVSLSVHVFGDGPLGLRFFFPLLAAGASVGAFLLGRELFGIPAGIWSAAALNTLPFFNMASVHVGPELPALTFALLAAWAFVRAMDRGIPWWALGGISLAIAEQFHYAAVLLLIGVATACAASYRHRVEWRRGGIYIGAFPALAALIPAIEWNAMREWPLLAGGTLHTALSPRWDGIGGALHATLVLFTVFATGALVFAIASLFRAARLHLKPRVALLLAAPFAILWVCDILHGRPGAGAFLFVSALLAGAAAHVFLESAHFRTAGAALILLTALSSTWPAKLDPWTESTHGIAWRTVAASLDELLARAAARPGRQPPILIAQDADATSALNYHLARTTHPEVFLRESQDASNQYALWPRYDDFSVVEAPKNSVREEGLVDEGVTTNPYMGRDALYITTEERADLPQTIASAFASVVEFATLDLGGSRKLRVYLCEDYQTMPL